MLDNIDLFDGLSSEALSTIETYVATRTYKKNTVIIEKGDDSSSLFMILTGSVKAYNADEEGKEIVLNTLEAGEYVGELALLGKSERTASVMTLEDSKMAVISKSAFMDCIKRNPDIAFNIIGGLVHKLDKMIQKTSDLGLKDVYGRISSLLQQRVQDEDGKLITAKMTQQQIANEVGSTRETVMRILKELKTGGYLSVTSGRYIIEKKLPARW